MGNRPRKTYELIGEIVIDETAYMQNKSSKNARKILERSERIEMEIWCDQHYYRRAQLGDENGRREGIDEESIRNLVVRSIPHLLYHSFKVKNFAFINFAQAGRNIRTVLQEYKINNMLNAVTEFHHIEKNKYQVTVITAMQNEGFLISQGQFALELDGDGSILRKCDGKNMIDVDSYN